jgi:hypothetical protein
MRWQDMRVSCKAVDTDRLAWQQLSDVMHCKLLNGSPDDGPHTLLLRSNPREPGPSFGQYHPDDEEFLCLEGDFTFDGSTWLGADSYVFYPAYFVHGTCVHVRGGYEVYLRRSGSGSLFKVSEPQSHVPYYVGEGQAIARAVQLVDAMNPDGVNEFAENGSLLLLPLHRDGVAGTGSTLLTATQESVGQVLYLDTAGLLEVFVVSGHFSLADGSCLKARTYHCEVGKQARLALQCNAEGILMLSHDGELGVQADAANPSFMAVGQ